jgi:hypothetical protein
VSIHTDDHDPTLEHETCETCNGLLRRAFAMLADRLMGPRDADELVRAIHEQLDWCASQPENAWVGDGWVIP